jgi:SAM-dependent methyltransferase
MSEAQLFVATTFTEIYERVLVGPLFRPFAEQLVSRVAPNRGDRVIDVACGTGIVARVARERLGPEARIVGVDVAPAMLAVARTVDPTIEWREGDAFALPVNGAEDFTVLTCHQGYSSCPTSAVAGRHVGPIIDSRHSFGDANGLRNLLVDAGFSDANVATIEHDVQLTDGACSRG